VPKTADYWPFGNVRKENRACHRRL
jgi:hypothetical protein